VHNAFWNSLKEDFEKNPVEYKHAFVIITEAKQVFNITRFFLIIFNIILNDIIIGFVESSIT
jgi:hypothetical protein